MRRVGFSLIQMSILVAVAGIVLASILPGGKVGSDSEKNAITLERMAAIEKATEAFMAMNLRRPCPADGSLGPGDANYGYEAGTAGTPTNGSCLGTTPAANFVDSITVTGDTDTASADGGRTITNLSSTAGIHVGSLVRGTGITDSSGASSQGTFVTSIESATSIKIDKPATATNVGVSLTFYTVVAGTVPFRSLGLPEEYSLDGYGRRIMYVVDKRAAIAGNSTPSNVHHLTSSANSCGDIQRNGMRGAIRVLDSASSTVAKDNVMWALISYGKSGHGAFPMQGSSVANRIDADPTHPTTNIDDDALLNAFVDSSFAYTAGTTFQGKLVQREADTTSANLIPYDNLVWYADKTKNTCCIGKACNLGFNMDLSGSVADTDTGTTVASGDINGDGLRDLVIGHYSKGTPTNPTAGPVFGTTGQYIWVVFGSKTGWPVASKLQTTDITGTGTTYNGRYGFYIFNNLPVATYFGQMIAVGDISQDGYDDIITPGGRGIIIFGKPVFDKAEIKTSDFICDTTGPVPAAGQACTVGTLNTGSGVTSTNVSYGGIRGIFIQHGGTGFPSRSVIMADIEGNGYKSAIFSGGTGLNYVYVLYSSPMSTWNTRGTATGVGAGHNVRLIVISTAGGVLTVADPSATVDVGVGGGVGFRIVGSGSYPVGTDRYSFASGDLDNNGFQDFVLGSSTYNSSAGAVYVLFSGTGKCQITSGTPDIVTLAGADCLFNGTEAVMFTSNAASETILGHTTTVADFNGDGYADIAMASDDRIYGYYGDAAGANWTTGWGTINIATAADFIIHTNNNRPGVIAATGNFPTILRSGDMNNDGRPDLILGIQDTDLSTCGKGTLTGSVYVIPQPSGGYPAGPTDLFDSTTLGCTSTDEINTTGFPGTFRIDGSTRSKQMYIPTVGDFNGDGLNDISIASPGYDTGSSVLGGVLTLYGRKNVPWDSVVDTTDIDY